VTLFGAVNAASNAVCAPWFALLAPLPATVQVLITAVPVTLFALLVFRFVSDQDGIRIAKDRIKAHLLELWLYKDDPAVLIRAQGQVVVHSLAYLGYSLVPMLVMLGPVALLLVQIESRFAWRAPAPGEGVIVTVTVAGGAPAPTPGAAVGGAPAPTIAPQPDDAIGAPGLTAETPALHIPDRNQVLWRIRGEFPGEHTAGIDVAGERVERRIVVGDGGLPLAPATYRENDWRILGYPAERPLPADSPMNSVEVDYPRARAEWLGLSSMSWLLFGATLVLGFALRGALGVTF
jgi:hypothetical protein